MLRTTCLMIGQLIAAAKPAMQAMFSGESAGTPCGIAQHGYRSTVLRMTLSNSNPLPCPSKTLDDHGRPLVSCHQSRRESRCQRTPPSWLAQTRPQWRPPRSSLLAECRWLIHVHFLLEANRSPGESGEYRCSSRMRCDQLLHVSCRGGARERCIVLPLRPYQVSAQVVEAASGRMLASASAGCTRRLHCGGRQQGQPHASASERSRGVTRARSARRARPRAAAAPLSFLGAGAKVASL